MDYYRWDLHVGWFSTYILILILLLMAEMYAVGARADWTFTRNLLAVVERAPWTGIIVLVFLSWLWLHFAIPIIGILRKWW
jgi:hypothetical protein